MFLTEGSKRIHLSKVFVKKVATRVPLIVFWYFVEGAGSKLNEIEKRIILAREPSHFLALRLIAHSAVGKTRVLHYIAERTFATFCLRKRMQKSLDVGQKFALASGARFTLQFSPINNKANTCRLIIVNI